MLPLENSKLYVNPKTDNKSLSKYKHKGQIKPRLKRVPNCITLARGILIVPITFLVLGSPLQAFYGWLLFFIACIGDHLDGYLARRWQAVSIFGTAFDPILDKILILALFLAVLARGGVDLSLLAQKNGDGMSLIAFLCANLIITREIIVSGLREFIAQKLKRSLPVIKLAKYKTVLQMMGIGGQSLSVGALDGQRILWFSLLADAVLLLACIITVYTGWTYALQAFSATGKNRKEK